MTQDDPEDRANSAFKAMKSVHANAEAPTKEDIAGIGLALWPHTYKVHPDDDYAAFASLLEWTEAQQKPLLKAALLIPSEQISMLGAARWADQAFPRFIMSHSYAAGLMATALSEDALELVRAPYKAFMIDVPDGLLKLFNERTGRESKIRWVLVHEVESRDGRPWQYIAHTEDSLCLWRHGVDAKYLCEPELPSNRWEGAEFISPKDERDDRVAALIGRLIVGVCLSFLDPENVRPSSKHRPAAHYNPERMGVEDIRTFKIGKKLKVDCRQSIEDYVAGVRPRVQNVRTLVRGHWRMQRHGPKLSLKKPIWLQPFWRGPKDGPVLVRPTVMGDDK
jgi:hypothetical protein